MYCTFNPYVLIRLLKFIVATGFIITAVIGHATSFTIEFACDWIRDVGQLLPLLLKVFL